MLCFNSTFYRQDQTVQERKNGEDQQREMRKMAVRGKGHYKCWMERKPMKK